MQYPSIILYSGGIDSFIGRTYLGFPQAVYFNIDSKYSISEIWAIQKQLGKDILIDTSIRFLGSYEEPNGHVPYRNLLLLLVGAIRYSDTLYLCGLKDDNVSDKKKDLFEEYSALLTKVAERPILVTSPFWDMTKVDICKWYSENHDARDLLSTYSCYSGKTTECGACPACLRKRVALYQVGIELPFTNLKLIESYELNMGHYDEQRQESMKKYFQYIKG